MKFSVIVTPRARTEFYNDALWWAENRSIDQATRWLDGFEQAIKLLAETADSYPLARENDDFHFDLRQMNYGIGSKPTHRAVFEIRGENADLTREQKELASDGVLELEELAGIYVQRGLDKSLAMQVAQQLMAHDALGAYARDELGISEQMSARPVQAAIASAATFAVGAALPLGMVFVSPESSIPIFSAHGEEPAAECLSGLIQERWGWPVSIPEYESVMPHLLGGDGVFATLPLTLTDAETTALKKSVSIIHDAIELLR